MSKKIQKEMFEMTKSLLAPRYANMNMFSPLATSK